MITYKKSGVNVAAGNQLVDRIKRFAPKIGGFSDGMKLPKGIKEPIILGCADGVGTKLAIAQKLNIHDTIGFDLVGMNVNDLICSGGKPLFFLDYFACGKLNVKVAQKVVKGIAKACEEAQCSLLGGETAEMPGFYKPGEYDLAGFATGVVERSKRLNPKKSIRPGDLLLGIPSSGIHSNGYSLVRKLFSAKEWKKKAGVLLKPTKIYVKDVVKLLGGLNVRGKAPVRGLVHITGGGFTENIPRILPPDIQAKILIGSWKIPAIFKDIQKRGKLPDAEMFKTFNMGMGMVVALDPSALPKARKLIRRAVVIGSVQRGKRGVVYV